MTAYTWIVFDADGTLFDFEHAEQSALARALGRFGIRLTPAIHLAYDQISAELWARFEVGDIDSQRLRVERFERLIDRFSFDVTRRRQRPLHREPRQRAPVVAAGTIRG